MQKVAPNAKSCSKVAEHNRDRPKFKFLTYLKSCLRISMAHDSNIINRQSSDGTGVGLGAAMALPVLHCLIDPTAIKTQKDIRIPCLILARSSNVAYEHYVTVKHS